MTNTRDHMCFNSSNICEVLIAVVLDLILMTYLVPRLAGNQWGLAVVIVFGILIVILSLLSYRSVWLVACPTELVVLVTPRPIVFAIRTESIVGFRTSRAPFRFGVQNVAKSVQPAEAAKTRFVNAVSGYPAIVIQTHSGDYIVGWGRAFKTVASQLAEKYEQCISREVLNGNDSQSLSSGSVAPTNESPSL